MDDITKYSKLGINKIRATNVLDTKDFKKISLITSELQRTFEVNQIWRTETEMRYSVLNDTSFPTPASKYWQCIREQTVFYQNLIYLACEYEEKQGELELLEIDLDELKQDKSKRVNARRKIKQSQINRIKFTLMEMRLQGHDRVREIELWEKLKEEQKQKADFNINDVNLHQKESYAKRWEEEMKIGQISNQADLFRHSKANLDTLLNDDTS
jgi:hypothetical protein